MSDAEDPDLGVAASDDGLQEARASRFRFAGIIKDGPTDVAAAVDAHLADGFGCS